MNALKSGRSRLAGSLIRALLVGLVALAPALPSAPATAQAAADTATVLCRVETTWVGVGLTTTLFVEVQDVSNLFGYALDVHYDPAKLEVLDGDAVRAGVNFTLGDFLFPDFVILNDVDNGAGVGQLALTQVGPEHTPQSGSGELAHVLIRGKSSGAVNITLENVDPVDNEGHTLAHQVQNCSVSVTPPIYLPLVLR